MEREREKGGALNEGSDRLGEKQCIRIVHHDTIAQNPHFLHKT